MGRKPVPGQSLPDPTWMGSLDGQIHRDGSRPGGRGAGGWALLSGSRAAVWTMTEFWKWVLEMTTRTGNALPATAESSSKG